MDTATKTAKNVGMDAANTTSKRIVQNMAEATGNLIGNKIVDKLNSVCKPEYK